MRILPVTISPSELIEFLSLQLNNLPDKRKGSNTTYEIREFNENCWQIPCFRHVPQSLKQDKKNI